MRIVGSMEELLGLKFSKALGKETVILRRHAFHDAQEEEAFNKEQREMIQHVRETGGWTPGKEWMIHASIPAAVMHALDLKYGPREVNRMIRDEDPKIQEWLVRRNRWRRTRRPQHTDAITIVKETPVEAKE